MKVSYKNKKKNYNNNLIISDAVLVSFCIVSIVWKVNNSEARTFRNVYYRMRCVGEL